MTAQRPRRPDPGAPRRRRRLYDPLPPEEASAVPPEGPSAPSEEPPVTPAPIVPTDDRGTSAVPAPVATGDRARPAVGRESEASRIVRKYVYWSAGIGLVGVPFLSTAVTLGVQVRMVKALAELYGVPFSEHRAKALLATLLGGLGTVAISRPLLTHALVAAGPVTWPLLPAASATAASLTTYAIGRVFIQHFELGGTLLDFRPEQTRAALEAQLRRA